MRVFSFCFGNKWAFFPLKTKRQIEMNFEWKTTQFEERLRKKKHTTKNACEVFREKEREKETKIVSVIASACIFKAENVKILYMCLRCCVCVLFFFLSFFTSTLPFLVRLLLMLLMLLLIPHFLLLCFSFSFFMSLHPTNHNKTAFFSFSLLQFGNKWTMHRSIATRRVFFYIAYMCSG